MMHMLTYAFERPGLIITDAKYGPAEVDDVAKGLDIDVTIPLQVLVNNSQLYIPGRRSKVRSARFHTFLFPYNSLSFAISDHRHFMLVALPSAGFL